MRELTAAPDLDGWAIAERLLKDMMRLEEPVWLVIDDVHELGSDEARRQLELLVMRGPPDVRFVLVTRHDLRLGLHRLRLEGELTEIRAPDLQFTTEEARGLLDCGWGRFARGGLWHAVRAHLGLACGLRLAALSGRLSRSGAVRGRVLRQRADGGGVPAGRGAGAAER